MSFAHFLLYFKNSFRNTISLSNGLDPDQSQLSVGPDLGPSCLQRLLASGLQIRERNKKLFSYFSTKTYVVGTKKNRLNEKVLLDTHNICLN